MPQVTRSILLNVPPRVIYEVVVDFEKYPQFLPEVKKASVREGKGRELFVDFEIRMIKTISYRLKISKTPSKKVCWSLVGGEFFRENRGEWQFEPHPPNGTRATYSAEVDFQSSVPSVITEMLVGSQLSGMLKRFKERAEERHTWEGSTKS